MDESESSPEVSSLILAQEYESALSELVINSKTIINTLTMVAGENIQAAEIIVSVIEKRIKIVKKKIFFFT